MDRRCYGARRVVRGPCGLVLMRLVGQRGVTLSRVAVLFGYFWSDCSYSRSNSQGKGENLHPEMSTTCGA